MLYAYIWLGQISKEYTVDFQHTFNQCGNVIRFCNDDVTRLELEFIFWVLVSDKGVAPRKNKAPYQQKISITE
jgi:hypothetical protein